MLIIEVEKHQKYVNYYVQEYSSFHKLLRSRCHGRWSLFVLLNTVSVGIFKVNSYTVYSVHVSVFSCKNQSITITLGMCRIVYRKFHAHGVCHVC